MSQKMLVAGAMMLSVVGSAQAQLLSSLLSPLSLSTAGVKYGCDWLEGNDADTNNTGYLDTQATYRTANIPVTPPAGAYIRVQGQYPKARYFGFQTYDGFRPGNIIDRLPDSSIVPDDNAAIDANPANLPVNADYTKTFTFEVRFEDVPVAPLTRAPNVIYAGRGSKNAAISKQLGFRLYFPNTPGDKLGGVPLASLTYVGPDGGEINLNTSSPDKGSCNLVKTVERYNILFPTVSKAKSQKNIAFTPIANANTKQVYPNPDANYLQAELGRSYGDLVLVRQLNQVTPKLPPLLEAAAQVRYWSLCMYQVLNSAVTGCITDTQMKLLDNQKFVTVISVAAKRPAMATPEYGYNWLPYGNQALGIVLLRQVLSAPDFGGNYAKSVAEPERPVSETLGAWAPEITYCSSEVFAAFAGAGGDVAFDECRAAANAAAGL